VRIARIEIDGRTSFAIVRGDRVCLAGGDPFGGLSPSDVWLPISGVRLLAPVEPKKIVAIARNYRAHAAEMNQAVSEEAPLFFLKATSAVIGPNERIVMPPRVGRVDYEGELAVIVSRRAKNVAQERALEHVLGYTCLNDVTARDLQKTLGHFTQAKGYDTFCPIGPWIETELDPSDLLVETRKNGELVQSGRTSEMVHKIPALIAAISSVMTLEPGDVIATGTPKGIGPLAPGDKVEITIENLGTLESSVVLGEGSG
jgi:2-keto-4-pentenoate hydratase/2-oxohepta-3-ene-1,7-dioic acid hydratase in catechol pathway